jgi:hypothetical protein
VAALGGDAMAAATMRRAEAREGSLGGRVALPALPSSLPSVLPPRGVPAAHAGLVARSANGGSERAHAVASAAVRWPSSWMAEAMELGCNRCVRVRWRRRSMCQRW